MDKKIIIADEMHPSIVPDLRNAGFTVDYMPDITREELMRIFYLYQGIIIRSKTTLDRELIDTAPDLRFIARAGAGKDKIDEHYCTEKSIRILNAPEGNRDALGEHAIGILLTLLNRVHTADREIRGGIWDREGNRGTEIRGKVIAIIGYGNMGSAFAQRLSGFDCSVLAYDKYKEGYGDNFAEESDMERIFREADIVSLHVPLTSETAGYYDYGFFNNFENNIFLINTARGRILPLADLIRLLNEGKILGAALDVLENEKLKFLNEQQKGHFSDLAQRDNLVLTPHVGGWSYESYKRINDVLVQKIQDLYNA